MARPCVFFDRDGVVNVAPDPARYVVHRDKFHLIPAFVDSLRIVTERGYPAVVVTNQRGISIGAMAEEEVDAIHAHLRELLAAEGLALTDVLVCPHDDDAHPWRKPNPGMLLEAARRHDLDLPRSWMIGDSEKDIEAGGSAGCHTVRVAPLDTSSNANERVASMDQLPALLDAHLPHLN